VLVTILSCTARRSLCCIANCSQCSFVIFQGSSGASTGGSNGSRNAWNSTSECECGMSQSSSACAINTDAVMFYHNVRSTFRIPRKYTHRNGLQSVKFVNNSILYKSCYTVSTDQQQPIYDSRTAPGRIEIGFIKGKNPNRLYVSTTLLMLENGYWTHQLLSSNKHQTHR